MADLDSSLPRPQRFEAAAQNLGSESVLSELPLYGLAIAPDYTGQDLAYLFQRYPDLPGVVLQTDAEVVGVIGRQRFLEYLLWPQGAAVWLAQPLWALHGYNRCPALCLPASTPILSAARQALRRSPLQRPDPILVESADGQHCLLDIHELYLADWQIRGLETQARYERMQMQMIQHEKMSALGRLVDGVTHEILDPVGFIWGNVVHVSTYCDQMLQLLHAYQAEHASAGLEPSAAIAHLEAELELDYLTEDLPRTLRSIQSGAERLKTLAMSLQNFCYIDDVYPKPADLHDCLNSLLLLLEHHLAGRIRIVRQYASIPPISCFIGQLSQVFINLLTRAVETLLKPTASSHRPTLASHADSPATAAFPCITVRTRMAAPGLAPPSPLPTPTASTQRWVVVTLEDNGVALSTAECDQLRHSFSVEQRTLQETSLALSYRIVTAKHGGKLVVRSPLHPAPTPNTPASGTAFDVWLPLTG